MIRANEVDVTNRRFAYLLPAQTDSNINTTRTNLLSQHLPTSFIFLPYEFKHHKTASIVTKSCQSHPGHFASTISERKITTYFTEMSPAIFADNHEDYHCYLRSIDRIFCLICCKAIGFANPIAQRKSLFAPESISEMSGKERAETQQTQMHVNQHQKPYKTDSTEVIALAASKTITSQKTEERAQCDNQSSSRQCESVISLFPSRPVCCKSQLTIGSR